MRRTGLSKDLIIEKENGLIIKESLSLALEEFQTLSFDKLKIIKSVKDSLSLTNCAEKHISIYNSLSNA